MGHGFAVHSNLIFQSPAMHSPPKLAPPTTLGDPKINEDTSNISEGCVVLEIGKNVPQLFSYADHALKISTAMTLAMRKYGSKTPPLSRASISCTVRLSRVQERPEPRVAAPDFVTVIFKSGVGRDDKHRRCLTSG